MTSKWIGWALSAALCATAGCGTRDRTPEQAAAEASSEQVFGRLHLPLVTPQQDSFRLSSATFDIRRNGQVVTTLDSESAPQAVSLDAELLQGSYEILLHDGWSLQRVAADAGVSVPAALLTSNPLSFQVDNGRVTDIVYSFTTEQGVVSFGRGEVSVSVNVTPTPSQQCNVLDRSSCPNGQTCLFAGDSGQTFCAEPGSLPVGSPCNSEQCVVGAQCLSLDAGHPAESTCRRFCNPSSRFCGCQGLSVDANVGVCTDAQSAGVVFAQDFPSPNACGAWNAFRNQLTSANFERVTLAGSRGGFFECDDANAAGQVCRALRNDGFASVNCGGHNWLVADCGSGPELSVDSSVCGCSFSGNNLRPCSGNFGGVGTDTCGNTPVVPQRIEVTCEGGSSAVCGNGLIETGESCDTNGAGADVLPAGVPAGTTCNATCTALIPPPFPCGNGVINSGEVCDTNGAGADVFPPNTPVGSLCNATCTAIIPVIIETFCGNGIIEPGEACDTNGAGADVLPPNTPVGSTCNATCTAIILPLPFPLCGNGVIEPGEVCDTNGAGVDVVPPNTPVGSTCNATCTAIIPGADPGRCLQCARTNCPTQFNNAVGSSSSTDNTANVTQLFDCVIGPNWEAGGPIPQSSCFFADPLQSQGSLVPCYCGSTPINTCLASGPADPEQECGREIELASLCNPVVASCVTGSGSDPNVPLGDALALLNCERAACHQECGFPIIEDE